MTYHLQSIYEKIFTRPLDFPSPYDIKFLGIPGSQEGGASTFLGFGPRQDIPYLVIKLYRNSKYTPSVEQEATILTLLQNSSLANFTPTLLLHGNAKHYPFLAQSVLPGSPLQVHLGADGLPDAHTAEQQFTLATQWLKDLAHVPLSSPIAGPSLTEQLDQDYLIFKHLFNEISAIHLSQISDQFTILKTLSSTRPYIQHTDFCRHNILLDRESLYVIDWSGAIVTPIPAQDLFFFLTTYFLQIRTVHGMEGFIDAFQKTWLQDNPFHQRTHYFVTQFFLELNLDIAYFQSLFTYFLVKRSILEYTLITENAARWGLPRFTVSLALPYNLDYNSASKVQVWKVMLESFLSQLS